MKIGINTRLLQEKYHTGVQNYIKNLYEAVDRLDNYNQYFYLKPSLNQNVISKVAYDNYFIKTEIREKGLNLFHGPASVLPIGKKTCPQIVTIHDLWFKIIPEIGRNIDRLYYNFAFNNLLKTADLVIADSEAVAQEIKKYSKLPDSKIKTILLGIDPLYFEKENPEYLNQIKKKYGLDSKKIILTNSVHSRRKNLPLLIKAFTNIQASFKDAVLVIYGAIDKSRLVIKSSRSILVLGYLDQKESRALYQLSDIFIYPSLYEGFGLPILEAMASNCLVLASKIPSLEEIVTDQSLLFNPASPDQISERIEYYLKINDGEKQAVLNTFPKILENYSWEKTARKMINIFNSF